ncbi:hypothetical protein [Sphingobium sp. WCS2017Hpa-17]|uniref:hypothetical protein n=1 Tax=Sphingobium sp. WCS2017Hpa-17 TaxID=3073638 RepID=UPI00288C26E4|nr:hypothetical protein [Sphingobium sp. WCS2017Hpa-17]
MLPNRHSADQALKRVALFTLVMAFFIFPILMIQLLNIAGFRWTQAILHKLDMHPGDDSLIAVSAFFCGAVFLHLAALAGRKVLQ